MIIYQGEHRKMKRDNCLGINVIVHEVKEGDKNIFVVGSESLCIADYGDTIDEAYNNFKKSAKEFLEVYPEKKKELIEEEGEIPPMLTRIFL